MATKWMKSFYNSLISVTSMVTSDNSLSEVDCSIAVHFTIIPFEPAVTLATDATDVNGRDLRVEFLVRVNIIPLINSVVRGDISEISLVLESD